MNALAWLTSAMLIVVAVGCWFHLNYHTSWSTPWCHKLGFVATGGGAVALAIEAHLPGARAAWPALLLYTGLFFVVLAIYREDFRAVLALAREHFRERRVARMPFAGEERRGRSA